MKINIKKTVKINDTKGRKKGSKEEHHAKTENIEKV
jgi:hypothetical protein